MSERPLQEAFTTLRRWAQEAHAQGWLDDTDLNEVNAVERATADDLFVDTQRRPLLVGLFGGTGVGKSSLVNRLAGAPIARIGVERPTSREITLYLHESHALASLPAEFPVDKTRVCRHHDDSKRDVGWIDMPDMDSTEAANRKLAFAWLPYIDWIVYVVSPERYRDDAGWLVLKARGHRHRWLFVMNHWDLGRQPQVDEFMDDLVQAGFERPTVITTISTEPPGDDEFHRLEQTIRNAIERHGLAELQRLGVLSRLRDIEQLTEQLRTKFGDEPSWASYLAAQLGDARQTLERLGQGLQWPIEALAERFRTPRTGWFRRTPAATGPSFSLGEVRDALCSDRVRRQLDDLVSRTVIEAGKRGIATTAVCRAVESSLAHADDDLSASAFDGLQRALARPGTPLQRAAQAALRGLFYGLPLATAGWAVYHTVARYRLAVADTAAFLGLDFAVHSLLMILLAWLVPFVVHRWTRPTRRAAARRGLNAGVEEAIAALIQKLETAHHDLDVQRRKFLHAAGSISEG